MGMLVSAGWMPSAGMKMRFDPVGAKKVFDEAIYTIRSTTPGGLMLGEIEACKNEVEIWPAGATVDSTCQVDRQHGDVSCYAEVLTDEALRRALKRVLDADGAGAAKSHERVMTKFASLTGQGCSWKVEDGWSVPEIRMDGLQRGKIAYYIRDKLTPGDGAPKVTVLWNIKTTDSRHVKGYEGAAWSVRPVWLALAHELVHAWRWVTGRAVFHPNIEGQNAYNGYHEEAMTVGLPPYDSCVFTENKFRIAKGEAPRTWYGPETLAKTEKAMAKYSTATK